MKIFNNSNLNILILNISLNNLGHNHKTNFNNHLESKKIYIELE